MAFRARHLPPARVQEYYEQAFIQVETVLLQLHLNETLMPGSQTAELAEAAMRLTRLERDFAETMRLEGTADGNRLESPTT